MPCDYGDQTGIQSVCENGHRWSFWGVCAVFFRTRYSLTWAASPVAECSKAAESGSSFAVAEFGALPASIPSAMERLSSADLKSFRALLLAERASILGTSSEMLDVLVPSEGLSAEDQARLTHDQFVALHCHSRDLEKLKKIGAAIERLQDGDFGICRACEEPIPRKRLLAIPWADRCVPCMEQVQGARSGISNVERAA